ncbi:MAG: DUF5103 domain-containing protein [Prevotellaceae bacterium]|jgi:hypothetical protein|nr:DUF5103 domain-containing protein [Prevotellaceae bacterium]
MKTIRYISLILLLACAFTAHAQLDLRLNKKFVLKDHCYDKQIKSILMFKGDDELSDPILEPGSTDVLTVMFDDLNENGRSLYYTIVHCDADWNEDATPQNDYMTGFTQSYLRDYEYSINTRIPYFHYKFTVPNNDISLKISGNYLVKVYDYSNPDTPLFQKGFSIVESKVALKLQYENLTNRGLREQQQLNFSLSYAGLNVMDPYRDFKIRIEKNSHRIPEITIPTPTFISGTNIDYSQPTKNIYPGGNEYRPFDIRTLEYAAQGVSLVDLRTDGYHALLNNAATRANKPYLYERDLNGKYYIDYRTKFGNKHIEADYVQVYFTLPKDEPYPNATLYVFGQLSDWSIYDGHAMVYSYERRAYELMLTLKQAMYNYMIIAVDDEETFDEGFVEGNFSETENSYSVYVYFRSPRDRWDRLVAIEQINTLTQKGSFSGVINF